MFYTFDTDMEKLLCLIFNQLEEQKTILIALSEKVDNLADLSKNYEFDIKENTDFQDLLSRTQEQAANINSLEDTVDYIYRNEVKLAEDVGGLIKSTTAAHNRIDEISAMANREMSRISNIENRMGSKIDNIETRMRNKDMEFNDFKNRVRGKLGI